MSEVAVLQTEFSQTRKVSWGRLSVIAIPYFWLLLFFLVPFLIVFKISLSDTAIAKPPYVPTVTFNFDSIKTAISEFDVENYYLLTEGISFNGLYWFYSLLLFIACYLLLTGLRFTWCLLQKDFFVWRRALVPTVVLTAIAALIVQKIIWTESSKLILFGFLFEDNIYVMAYLSSLKMASVATVCTLIVGYPIAYAMARAPKHLRTTLLMLVILPFWTSFLVRVYAWIGILKTDGFLNQFLQFIGIIDEPLAILHSDLAVYIGIIYSYLPFLILPLYATLEKMDHSLTEAAQDMGCTPLQSFWLVTFPLSMPGVVAGCFLVFIPAVGEFVIPDLLGGSNTLMIGKTLWVEFFYNRDWPVAAAVATILLILLVVPIVLFQRYQDKQQEAEA